MAHLSRSTFNANQLMLQPYDYILQTGMNKRCILSRLWTSFDYYFDCPKEKVREMGVILRDLLNISYMWDDIEDASKIRKGVPTGHLVFGKGHVIFGVMYTACVIHDKIFDFGENKEEVVDDDIRVSLEILQNTGLIIYYKRNFICPTYEEYEKYLCEGSWLYLGVTLLRTFAKRKSPKLSTVLQHKTGLFIQVYNDYLNVLQSSKYSDIKTWCEDLTEGKYTFLVIHAIQTHPEDELLKEHSDDVEEKKRYVGILEELGSIEFAKTTMRRLRSDILEEAERVYKSKNPYLEKMLDDVLGGLETNVDFYVEIPE